MFIFYQSAIEAHTFPILTFWFLSLRLIVHSGNSSLSPTLFDSDADDVPERGLLSEGSTMYLELTADSSSIPLLLALRYEGEHRDSDCTFFHFQQNSKELYIFLSPSL